jgi:hypothetical protein
MRWNKLAPLVEKVDGIHKDVTREFVGFQKFLQPPGNP